MLKIKNIVRLGTFAIRQGNIEVHSICNLKYSVCKEIPAVFYNGSNYDYHFIVKEVDLYKNLKDNLHV